MRYLIGFLTTLLSLSFFGQEMKTKVIGVSMEGNVFELNNGEIVKFSVGSSEGEQEQSISSIRVTDSGVIGRYGDAVFVLNENGEILNSYELSLGNTWGVSLIDSEFYWINSEGFYKYNLESKETIELSLHDYEPNEDIRSYGSEFGEVHLVDGMLITLVTGPETYELVKYESDGSSREVLREFENFNQFFSIKNGWIYGFDGTNYFKIDTDGNEQNVVSLNEIVTFSKWNSIIEIDSKVYGTADEFFEGEGGGVFRMNHDGTEFEVIKYFDPIVSYGSVEPKGKLVEYEGKIWGTTHLGGNMSLGPGWGMLFNLDFDGEDFQKTDFPESVWGPLYGINVINYVEILLNTEFDKMISLYPNPTTSSFRLKGMLPTKLVIRDIEGRIVSLIENLSNPNIDISELKTGLFFVETIDSSGKSQTHKLVIR